MEEKKNKTKQIFILSICVIAIVLASSLGTYAYFMASLEKEVKQELTYKTGTLSLVFEDNSDGINKALTLGESVTKEFKIRNTGTQPVTTNMLWSEMINTYTSESLSYKLEYKSSIDGIWEDIETVGTNVPTSTEPTDLELAKNITIPAKETYYYKLTITFNDLDKNQNEDIGAVFTSKFKIGVAPERRSPSKETLSALKLETQDCDINFETPATTDETVDGLCSLEDDYGTSYYFRGAVENNYVKFGGFYWRIIRINGDGSVRMIYDGTRGWPNANGTEEFTESGTDRFTHTNQVWNANSDDAKYAGWMFGGSNGTASTKRDLDGTENSEEEKSKAATYNQTDSNVKTRVDIWYKINIEDKGLSKYVSDEIFCNDRSMGGNDSTYTNLGYGITPTKFAAQDRLVYGRSEYGDATPTFKCAQKNDAFTVSDTTKGNGALTYPVGLITADEIVAAGSGRYASTNRYYYLYKTSNYTYWSFSPYGVGTVYRYVYVFTSNNTIGGLRSINANGNFAIAPVINLSAETAATLTGSGTMTDPYTIV